MNYEIPPNEPCSEGKAVCHSSPGLPTPYDVNALTKSCRPMSLTERLTSRQERLSSELREVNAALASLQKNPEIATALDNITRVFGESLL